MFELFCRHLSTSLLCILFLLSPPLEAQSPSAELSDLLEAHKAQNPNRPARGYQPRACGFDMNRNGIFGEAEDCTVCDGITTDPDSDGVDEDLFYVDCNNGTDSQNCGTPGNPCRTIQWAWDNRGDGPVGDIEDIICFRGSCTTVEFYSPNNSGVIGHYTVPASGSQARDWRYPRNPTMLVGWDSDGDGEYPPEDRDDEAVLDGSGLERAFRLDSDTDYLEMGHFSVKNYGRFTPGADDTGFLRFGPSFDQQEYQYFHDLELLQINMDRETTSRVAMISFFPTNSTPQWIQFANWYAPDNGQWFARGSGYDNPPDFGPFRFINITRTSHSCDFSDCGTSAGSTLFKLWGYMSGVEILDSIWDANPRAWEPKVQGGPSGSTFATAAHCSQDWMIRNNEVIDFKTALIVQGYADGFCNFPAARPTDGIYFDGNVVRNTFEPWRYGDHGIRIEDGGTRVGEMVGDVFITNNFLSSSTGWEMAIWANPGHDSIPPTGTITIANNTLYGNVNRYGAIVIGNVEGPERIFPHQNYVIENNILGGFISTDNGEKDLNIHTTIGPSNLRSERNVFGPDGQFVWNGGPRTGLGVWRSLTGGDSTSLLCEPAFADKSQGNFHLTGADSCARNRGLNPLAWLNLDLDGEPRQALGATDIGADELQNELFANGFEAGNTDLWTSAVP